MKEAAYSGPADRHYLRDSSGQYLRVSSGQRHWLTWLDG